MDFYYLHVKRTSLGPVAISELENTECFIRRIYARALVGVSGAGLEGGGGGGLKGVNMTVRFNVENHAKTVGPLSNFFFFFTARVTTNCL